MVLVYSTGVLRAQQALERRRSVVFVMRLEEGIEFVQVCGALLSKIFLSIYALLWSGYIPFTPNPACARVFRWEWSHTWWHNGMR